MTSSGTSRRRFLQAAATLPAALGGCLKGGAARPPDAPWHHGPDGFRNPPGSPEPGGGFGDWTSFFWRRLGAPEPDAELLPGHVLDPAAVHAGVTRLAREEAVLWLGHSCFLLRLGGLTVLTDPFLGERASPFESFGPKRLAPPPLPVAGLPPVDLVLLSHNHYDHLDLASLEELGGRQRPTLVTTLKVSDYLRKDGFASVHELDWHERLDHGPLAVTALPAIHFSKRTPFDRNASLWCGFLLQSRGRCVYFAGDTAHGPVFREIGAHYPPPDLALVPIGAYEPRELMQGSHCTPEEAALIGRELGARRLCAMHWGTIRLTDEPIFEPPARFAAGAARAGYAPEAAWRLAIGEARLL
ncbi:MBL fold metallo-hydrolase [Marinimicrococcus flavescens]|uniref:MBL fold metallo-hydrolase n=1 Tax=Marinimicrococcus flavescens TaxID=3031815 RepID=A0AAP3UXN3_9PROT|nr:MBL fold metallo-hydrolase [Marinimicrococcus flavescens]